MQICEVHFVICLRRFDFGGTRGAERLRAQPSRMGVGVGCDVMPRVTMPLFFFVAETLAALYPGWRLEKTLPKNS